MKEYISTTHELAKELLNKPDSFITATIDGKEYIIGNLRRISTHANNDDTVTHMTLQLIKCKQGNIKR